MEHEELQIDANFPGGNILVQRIAENLVELRQDVRDTENVWFYWCFRVRGAGGRRLTFRFLPEPEKRGPIGARGPAVSLDGGITWRWLGQSGDQFFEFAYQFPPEQTEVRFGMGMTYTQEHLDRFLRQVGGTDDLRCDALCQSRKGREVERLRLGRADAPRALLVTARHHCCEMMGSYLVEGMLEGILARDSAGQWLRENLDIVVIPFADKDGVEEGDQGKNRRPRDHNRDYSGVSIHPEVAAIRDFVPRWVGSRKLAMMDVHCPWLRGNINEQLYQVGQRIPALWQRQQQFGLILERVQRGPIIYHAADDLPFGEGWNTAEKRGNKGLASSQWAADLPSTDFATVFEVPYANAGGCEVNQASARELGRDVATALHLFLRV